MSIPLVRHRDDEPRQAVVGITKTVPVKPLRVSEIHIGVGVRRNIPHLEVISRRFRDQLHKTDDMRP